MNDWAYEEYSRAPFTGSGILGNHSVNNQQVNCCWFWGKHPAWKQWAIFSRGLFLRGNSISLVEEQNSKTHGRGSWEKENEGRGSQYIQGMSKVGISCSKNGKASGKNSYPLQQASAAGISADLEVSQGLIANVDVNFHVLCLELQWMCGFKSHMSWYETHGYIL